MKATNRRRFLRNISLSGLGLAVVRPTFAKKQTEEVIECDATTLDYYGEGPFYTDGPPFLENNVLAPEGELGTKLIISGRVLNLDCNAFIPDTIIDVWHADDSGAYDNEGYHLRGYVKSNAQGFYMFETILPGKYLNGASFRPSHIHYKITPPGFSSLTTQLYFEGDDSIPGDAAASIKEGTYDASQRIIPLVENTDGVLEGTFDIIINGTGIPVGTYDLHLTKGMVYKCSPNPFTTRLEIEYGVFHKAQAGLVVYNMAGQEVAVLEDAVLEANKYVAIWEPDGNLASGHYFIALKIEAFQVHYLKVEKL